ncbi:MAG: hypothetical protein MJ235_08610 [archaeon]|nr:hypothetical protein [archaeon]
MVNYEEEYDKFEDTPNNIDYGSWYEYDNFQDFIDGKNAMDLTEGEEIDYWVFNLPEDQILDFNELPDEETISREEYVNALIESKLQEKEALEEFLKSLEEDETDYAYLESLLKDDERNIEHFDNDSSEEDILEKISLERLIKDHLLEEEELNKEFLQNKSLEIDINDKIEDMDFEEFDYFEDDLEISEKYYEHIELIDDLHYKSLETQKAKKDDEDSFNEVTDYGDYPYDN